MTNIYDIQHNNETRINQYRAEAEQESLAKEAQIEKSSMRQSIGQAIINIGQKIASVVPQKA